MRRTVVIALAAALGGAVVLAEEPETQPEKKPSKLPKECFAGPAHIQQEFFDEIRRSLEEQLDKESCERLLENFAKAEIDADAAMRLMNGRATDSELVEWFDAARGETRACKRAVEKAVDAKNRKLYFGMLVLTLEGLGVPPEDPVMEDVAEARDDVTEEDFRRLREGNVTKSVVRSALRLRAEGADLRRVQQAVNQVPLHPFATHPLAQSLGFAAGSPYEAKIFPKLERRMAGWEGPGRVSGAAVPRSLPPTVYLGGAAPGRLLGPSGMVAPGPRPRAE